MELAVAVEKYSADGNPIPVHLAFEGESVAAPAVLLRVSQRALDPDHSTPNEPCLIHTKQEPLRAGEIVPVEIGLWPIGLHFRPGEQLVLTIAAHRLVSTGIDLGFGTAVIPIPADGGTFEPGKKVPLRELGGLPSTSTALMDEQCVPTTISRNKERQVFHLGGKL